MAFYSLVSVVETASELWQSILVLVALSAIVVYYFRHWLFMAGELQLTVALPEQTVSFSNQTYCLTTQSRQSFLGFWLTLVPTEHSGSTHSPSAKQYLFIPITQLNRQAISSLSLLVKGAC